MGNWIEQRDWSATASVCEFLAVSLAYPGDELVGAVVSGEWEGCAQEIADRFEIGSVGCDSWLDFDEAKHALRREATRLFLGPHEPPVSIYEGIWSAHDRGVAPLLFVSQAAMDVERFCKDCGLGRPEGTNESLDHVSTELELLQYLASVQAGIVVPSPGAPSQDRLPGGSAEAAYGMFASEHALRWMGRFADALEGETSLEFYRSTARILRAYVQAEAC